MASKMIHYIVGTYVSQELSLQSPTRFLAGNLYPDCVEGSGRKGRKGRSHFCTSVDSSLWRDQNCPLFLKKYGNRVWEDDLYLGYLCHLETDSIWHDDIFPYIKQASEGQSFETYKEPLYRDYHRLNEMLRNTFPITFTRLPKISCDIEEVQPELWEHYMDDLAYEFTEVHDACPEHLEILKWEPILAYINWVIPYCVEKLKEFRA